MKKLRTLLILCLVLIIAIVLVIMAKNGVFTKEETKTVYVSQKIFDYSIDKTTNFSWTVDGVTYSCSKDADGVWTYDLDPSLELDQSTIRSMLIIHHQMMAAKALDGVKDFSEFGIDINARPDAEAISDGVSYKLWIGKRTRLTRENIYAADQDGVVYVVDSYANESFIKSIEDCLPAEE